VADTDMSQIDEQISQHLYIEVIYQFSTICVHHTVSERSAYSLLPDQSRIEAVHMWNVSNAHAVVMG